MSSNFDPTPTPNPHLPAPAPIRERERERERERDSLVAGWRQLEVLRVRDREQVSPELICQSSQMYGWTYIIASQHNCTGERTYKYVCTKYKTKATTKSLLPTEKRADRMPFFLSFVYALSVGILLCPVFVVTANNKGSQITACP